MSGAHALNDSWPKGHDSHIVISSLDAMAVWTQTHDWIDRALDHPLSLITAADVFTKLLRGDMVLWGVHEHGVLVGAFVTRIESGSRGRAIDVVALGGEGMPRWIESFSAFVTRYARENHCRFVFEMGRPGWIKVLDKLGWTPGPATMVMVI
jgi:hypothetical protein